MSDAGKPAQDLEFWAASTETRSRGPFATELEAWESLRLSPTAQGYAGRIHIPGAYVWPRLKGAGP